MLSSEGLPADTQSQKKHTGAHKSCVPKAGEHLKGHNSVASAHSASAFPVEFLTQKQDPDSPLKREFSWVLGALADGQAHLYNQMLLISARYRCTEKTQTTELSS